MSHLIQSNTTDVRLFSALASMGIPWTGESAALASGDRVWLFGEVSDCGKWKLRDLLAWWRDPNFHKLHPDNPFNVVKSCMASGVALKKYIKFGGGIIQRKVDTSFVIDRTEDSLMTPPSSRATDDMAFAAALSSVGFRIHATEGTGYRRIFAISETSETKGYQYAQVRNWWLDKAFIESNPQHPFAYAKAVSITYAAAVKSLVSDQPLVKWKPKGSYGTAYIHPNCSKETESQVAGWLKNK